jgi:hypothetical protein
MIVIKESLARKIFIGISLQKAILQDISNAPHVVGAAEEE